MAAAEMVEPMTVEQFGQRPDPGYPEELVRGRVVAKSVPDRRHGYVCGKAVRIFGNFVDAREIGRVMCNDSGVITERDPDTVRGADVAYYSYSRLAKGALPTGYGPEVPELVVEVRSATDRWREILDKVETVATTVRGKDARRPGMAGFLGCYSREPGCRTRATLALASIQGNRCFQSEVGLLLPTRLHP
jgi:Uma2 family endonuclease